MRRAAPSFAPFASTPAGPARTTWRFSVTASGNGSQEQAPRAVLGRRTGPSQSVSEKDALNPVKSLAQRNFDHLSAKEACDGVARPRGIWQTLPDSVLQRKRTQNLRLSASALFLPSGLLIFYRRAALDQLDQRLLDANRTIGQSSKIATIFGRKVTKYYKGKLQTVIEDLDLPNPVIRTHYAHGSLKQYVRDHLCLRTEPATNDVTAYGVKKAVENLPQLRDRFSAVCDNYLNVQQDILESFVDRGQLHNLTQPTVLPSGKRIPGLKLDHPRQLALMHALVCFAHIAAGNTFTTAELYPYVLAALQISATQYSLASLRYDLRKLRVKDLVEKLPKSRRYRLRPQGYSICLVFLKLFERVYAPLTAGLLQPYRPDSKLQDHKRTQLDRLYQKIVDDLDELLHAVRLKAA